MAQINLGHAYAAGRLGPPHSLERAVSCCKQSAALGDTDAVKELERLGA